MKKLIFIVYAASFILAGQLVAIESSLDVDAEQKYPSAHAIAQDINFEFEIGTNLYESLSLAFSNDSKRVAVELANGALRLYDLVAGESLRTFNDPAADKRDSRKILQFSPDDKKIASTQTLLHPTKINLWDVASGKQDKIFAGHHNMITGLEFSHDGRKIVTIATMDDQPILWDVNTCKKEDMPRAGMAVTSARFSPDGRKLVATTPYNISLWDVNSRNLLQKIEWSRSYIYLAEFNPDGKKIAILTATTLGLLDVTTGESSYLTENLPLYSRMRFSPDGKKIAVYGVSLVKIFDVTTGLLALDIDGVSSKIHAVQFSRNGEEILVQADNAIKRFAVKTDKILQKIPLQEIPLNVKMSRFNEQSFSITQARFSSDGTKLVAAFSTQDKLWGKIFNLNNKLIKDYFMNTLPDEQHAVAPLQHQALLVLLDKISKENAGAVIGSQDIGRFENVFVGMPPAIVRALKEYYNIADKVFSAKNVIVKTEAPEGSVYTRADFLKKRK